MKQSNTHKMRLLGITLVAALCLFVSASVLLAEEGPLPVSVTDPDETPSLSAADILYAQAMADEVIELKAAIDQYIEEQKGMGSDEEADQLDMNTDGIAGQMVYRNDDMTIKEIENADGSRTGFSYEYDEEGKISRIILEKAKTLIVLTEYSITRMERSETQNDEWAIRRSSEEDTGPTPPPDDEEPPIIIIPDDPIDLDRIARDGLDFDELKKLFDEFEQTQQRLLQQFYGATEEYYDQVEEAWQVLKAAGDSFVSDFEDNNRNWKEGSNGGRHYSDAAAVKGKKPTHFENHLETNLMNEGLKGKKNGWRKDIEHIIEYIYTKIPQSDAERETRDAMIELEGRLREAILLPHIEAYRSYITEASAALISRIKNILKDSVGATVLSEHDKIEAIIILPAKGGEDETSDDTETETNGQ